MAFAEAYAWQFSTAPTHAIVSSCDGCGAFTFVAASPEFDGKHQVWVLVIRAQQDIRTGSMRSVEVGCIDTLFEASFLKAQFQIKHAVDIFLKPAVQRTAQLGIDLEDDVKMVVRYLERLGGSDVAHDSKFLFACPSLGLQGMGAGMKCVVGEHAAANIPERSHDEIHSMLGSGDLTTPWRPELQQWYFIEGDLHEAGVRYEFVGCEAALQGLALSIAMGLSEVEHVVRRVAAMVHHMFVVYSVLGDDRAADLFLEERDQIIRAAFYSGVFTAMSRRTTMTLVQTCACRIFNKEFPSPELSVARPKIFNSYNVSRGNRAKELLASIIRHFVDFASVAKVGFVQSLKDDLEPNGFGRLLSDLIHHCYQLVWSDYWMNNISAECRPNMAIRSLEDKLCHALRDRCLKHLEGHVTTNAMDIIVIHSLTNQTDLNHRLGIVVGPAPQSDRVAVQLLDAATCYEKQSGEHAPEACSMEAMFADFDLPQETKNTMLQGFRAAESSCRKSVRACNTAALDAQFSCQLGKIIHTYCPKTMKPSAVAVGIAAARLSAEIEIILAQSEALPRERCPKDAIHSITLKCIAFREAEALARCFRFSSASERAQLAKVPVDTGAAPQGALAQWFRCLAPGTLTWTATAARRLFLAADFENASEVTDALEELLGSVAEAIMAGLPFAKEISGHIAQWQDRWRDGSRQHERKMIEMAREAKRQQSCAVCGSPSKSRCSGCKSVAYCSASCAKSDWNQHKSMCKVSQVSKA